MTKKMPKYINNIQESDALMQRDAAHAMEKYT